MDSQLIVSLFREESIIIAQQFSNLIAKSFSNFHQNALNIDVSF